MKDSIYGCSLLDQRDRLGLPAAAQRASPPAHYKAENSMSTSRCFSSPHLVFARYSTYHSIIVVDLIRITHLNTIPSKTPGGRLLPNVSLFSDPACKDKPYTVSGPCGRAPTRAALLFRLFDDSHSIYSRSHSVAWCICCQPRARAWRACSASAGRPSWHRSALLDSKLQATSSS